MVNKKLSLIKFLCLFIMLFLFGCSVLNIGTATSQSGGVGSLRPQFDLGDDFVILEEETDSLSTQNLHTQGINDIESAKITITGEKLGNPIIKTYTRSELAYRSLPPIDKVPVGNATVKVELLDVNNKILAESTASVAVKAGEITPVNATLTISNQKTIDQSGATVEQQSTEGSLQLTISVTEKSSELSGNLQVKLTGNTVNVTITNIQGNVDRYVYDWGDETTPEMRRESDYSHTYANGGTYPLIVRLLAHGDDQDREEGTKILGPLVYVTSGEEDPDEIKGDDNTNQEQSDEENSSDSQDLFPSIDEDINSDIFSQSFNLMNLHIKGNNSSENSYKVIDVIHQCQYTLNTSNAKKNVACAPTSAAMLVGGKYGMFKNPKNQQDVAEETLFIYKGAKTRVGGGTDKKQLIRFLEKTYEVKAKYYGADEYNEDIKNKKHRTKEGKILPLGAVLQVYIKNEIINDRPVIFRSVSIPYLLDKNNPLISHPTKVFKDGHYILITGYNFNDKNNPVVFINDPAYRNTKNRPLSLAKITRSNPGIIIVHKN